METMGQRIKARRDELDIGPGQMCDKLGCTLSMLHRLEDDSRMPSVERLLDLSVVLKCTTDYLLTGKGKPKARVVPKPEAPQA